MGLSISELRKGMTLLYGGELYEIVDYEHNKRGRGSAVASAKLKHLKTGKVTTETFRGFEDTSSVFLESRELQYLFHDGDNLIFMDVERFDQFPISHDVLGPGADYLVEGTNVIGYYYNGGLITVDIPNFVELKVSKTEPGVRGDTVSNVDKPATLETGVVVRVPLFVKEGDRLKIDTRTGTYIERV
ncbi:MAG: elongation factor P [Candidatus Bipolaricaulota bacterium]